MQQIKFQAWDEQKKIMHNDFQFIKSGDTGSDWIIFMSDKQTVFEEAVKNPYFSQQLKIRQFTGLTDKNGKEIYNGDIVKNAHDWITDEKGKKLDFKKPSKKHIGYEVGLVEWEQETTSYIMGPHRCCLRTDMCLIEVIGNIYENPDLLK